MLLVFGFFGALAMLVFYLVDRGGRATPGMCRALLALLILQGWAAIGLVDSRPSWQLVLAGLAFAFPIGLVVAATFGDAFVEHNDWLPSRDDETLKPLRKRMRLPWVGGKPRFGRRVMLAGAVLAIVALLLIRAESSSETALVITGLAFATAFILHYARLIWSEIDKTQGAIPDAGKVAEEAGDDETRLSKRRPFRLVFRPWGMTLFTVSMAVAVAAPSLILAKAWLLEALIAAIVIVVGLWRVAALSRSGFMWFGLAAFLAVPLFGTLTAMARNLADPQAQPLALIRDTDGPDEAIQGLFVTETSNRVYFATVSTEGCGDKVVKRSGRLLWVPKSEVVAMSIGPLENVADARTTALEMAYALTPAVETPAGDHVSLTSGERRHRASAAALATGDRRLENVGAAVSPNFGAGLRLVPEDASAGDIVTLRMSHANATVGGFGAVREGRTLRLGGVPAPIVREKARDAEEAEFVKTKDGKIVALDKAGIYVPGDGGLVPIADHPDAAGRRFVRLADDSGVVPNRLEGPNPGTYLELDPEDETKLTEGQEVDLAGGGEATLEVRLLRQAWHENHIKFRVPENASTGVISVECEQLAGQPLLRVAKPPVARITVRMSPGSPRAVLDSRRSGDGNAEIVSRRWTVEGLRGAHARHIALSLPTRSEDYAVELTVTDAEGQTDSARLHILRLPAGLMRFDNGRSRHPEKMQRIRADLLNLIDADHPASLEFDAVPARVGSASADVALAGAKAVRDSLLTSKVDQPVDSDLTVRTLAYERPCPFHDGEGTRGGIDVIALSGGVEVVPPHLCPPRRAAVAHGLPLTGR